MKTNKEKLNEAIEVLEKIINDESQPPNTRIYASANMASLIKQYDEKYGKAEKPKQPLRSVKNF